MRNNRRYFRYAVLIILLIIIYSSFSDCIYTDKTSSDSYSLLAYTQNSPGSGTSVYYYHLPYMPIEEDYANLFLKVPYRLLTYRLGNITGMVHTFIASAVSMLIILAALSLKLPAADKPRQYFLLPLRGHGPPKKRLIYSLS